MPAETKTKHSRNCDSETEYKVTMCEIFEEIKGRTSKNVYERSMRQIIFGVFFKKKTKTVCVCVCVFVQSLASFMTKKR